MTRKDDKTLEKIRALTDRAVHPSTPIEEARTSALIAVRMAREAGLEVMTGAERRELVQFRQAAGRVNGSSPHANGTVNPASDPAYPFRHRARKRTDGPGDYAIITSMYNGYCRACRRGYKEGDEIAYRRGFGAT